MLRYFLPEQIADFLDSTHNLTDATDYQSFMGSGHSLTSRYYREDFKDIDANEMLKEGQIDLVEALKIHT